MLAMLKGSLRATKGDKFWLTLAFLTC